MPFQGNRKNITASDLKFLSTVANGTSLQDFDRAKTFDGSDTTKRRSFKYGLWSTVGDDKLYNRRHVVVNNDVHRPQAEEENIGCVSLFAWMWNVDRDDDDDDVFNGRTCSFVQCHVRPLDTVNISRWHLCFS